MTIDPLVIFLHLPKAAGSTLNRVIARHYPHTAIHRLEAKPRAELLEEVAHVARPPTPVRILTGHAGFGLHVGIAREFTYLTVLRDPVERLLSHFHFARTLPTHPLHEGIVSGRLGLPEVAQQLANLQTRYLIDDAMRNQSGATDAALLANAKENLTHHFSVVGLAERFDETLVLLQRKLGWRIATVSNSNVNRARPKLATHNAEDLAAVREANVLDLELYEWASGRFAAEVAAGGLAFRTALMRLRFRGRLRSWWEATKHTVRKQRA
jgi:hypothetical protein